MQGPAVIGIDGEPFKTFRPDLLQRVHAAVRLVRIGEVKYRAVRSAGDSSHLVGRNSAVFAAMHEQQRDITHLVSCQAILLQKLSKLRQVVRPHHVLQCLAAVRRQLVNVPVRFTGRANCHNAVKAPGILEQKKSSKGKADCVDLTAVAAAQVIGDLTDVIGTKILQRPGGLPVDRIVKPGHTVSTVKKSAGGEVQLLFGESHSGHKKNGASTCVAASRLLHEHADALSIDGNVGGVEWVAVRERLVEGCSSLV